MNYSFLKNVEVGMTFQVNGEDVVVAEDQTVSDAICQFCIYSVGKRDGSSASCTAPRNTGLGLTPCTRIRSASVRYIPLHIYAKLRIKEEL